MVHESDYKPVCQALLYKKQENNQHYHPYRSSARDWFKKNRSSTLAPVAL